MTEGLNIRIVSDVSGATTGIKQVNSELGKLSTTSKASSTNMLNFSRVIQDLPFGLVGIQNNLTQLIPGVGALGLAFTAVVTALTFAQVGFGAWTKGLGGIGKKAKETEGELTEFQKATKEVADSIADQASRVTTLVTALGTNQLDLKERKKAFEELKEINKDYFGSLKDEEGIIEKLQSAYKGYLSNLIEVGKTKAIESQLTKLFSKKLELELSINPKFIAASTKAVQTQVGFINKELMDLGGPVDVTKDKFDPLNKSIQRRIFLTQQLTRAEQGEQIVFGIGIDETLKDIRNVDTAIAGLTKILGDTGTFDIKVDKDKLKKELSTAAFDKMRSDLQREEAFGVIKLIDNEEALKELKRSRNALEASPLTKKALGIPLEFDVSKLTDFDFAKFLKLKELGEDLGAALEEAVENAFAAVGEGIGKAIADGDIGAIFDSLFQSIGASLKVFGQTLIAYGVAMEAFKKTFSNPIAAIAAGIALIAAGSLIQNAVPKLAEGGVIPPGFPNDSFPALLSSGEAVIPLNKHGRGFGSGNLQTVRVIGDIRGDKIKLLNARTDRRQGRGF